MEANKTTDNRPTFVPYLRVSSKGQGMGLQGQMRIIRKAVEDMNGVMICEPFKDKITGAEDETERKGLDGAIKLCQLSGATLIVQDLDRLGRDLADLTRLCFKSGIKVRPLNMSEEAMENKAVFGMMAGFAQMEREKMSGRVQRATNELKSKHLPKMAQLHAEGKDEEGERYWLENKSPRSRVTYAAWIRKGFRLGTPRTFTKEESERAATVLKESADRGFRNKAAKDEIIKYLTSHPCREDRTLRKIADHLNSCHIKTPRGAEHGAKSVQLLCRRYGIEWK